MRIVIWPNHSKMYTAYLYIKHCIISHKYRQILFIKLKNKIIGWRDDSAVKCIHCSCKKPGFLEQRLREWPSRDCPTWDLSHIQSPNTDTFVDANKCFLSEACYNCLWRCCTSAWQIQKWILVTYHWTEHRVPNEGDRERTQGAGDGLQPHRRNNNMN